MRSSGITLVLLLAVSCGGTEVVSSSSSSGSGGGSGSGSGSGSGNGSGSGSGSGGSMQPPDAGTDAPVLEGGAPDPGSVLCNGLPCASIDHYCCDDNMAGTEKCVPDQVSACAGFRRKCDEAADCPGGQVCCIPPNAAIFIAYNAFCVASCLGDPFSYQVCKTDAECQNGMACVTQPCHGETIQSCGPLPQNRCQ